MSMMPMPNILESLSAFRSKLPPVWRGFVWEPEDFYTDETGLDFSLCLYILFRDEQGEFRVGLYPRLPLFTELDSDTACRLLRWSHNSRDGLALMVLAKRHEIDTESFYDLALTYRCASGQFECRL